MKIRKWRAISRLVFPLTLLVSSLTMTSTYGIKPKDAKLEKKEYMLDVYVSDEQLRVVKSYKRKIRFANDDEKYQIAVQALKSPAQHKGIPLWKDVEFKSLKMEKGTLSIDLHIPTKWYLGSGGEQLALDALKRTIFQFDEVKAITILVDGKTVESLMGHVALKYPIKRP